MLLVSGSKPRLVVLPRLAEVDSVPMEVALVTDVIDIIVIVAIVINAAVEVKGGGVADNVAKCCVPPQQDRPAPASAVLSIHVAPHLYTCACRFAPDTRVSLVPG